MRACCSSAFNSARFTLDGHSIMQALQDRQLLSAASSSADTSGSPFSMPRNSSAARMALARPRVDMISSPVAMNVGHMLGVCLRQPPQPLHCSRLAVNDPSLRGKRQHRLKRQLQGMAGAQAQVAVNLEAAVGNDLARIEQIVRVEALLDLPHQPVNLLAHLLPEIFGAGDADAVFAGERPLELPHQRGHLVGDLAELLQILRRDANPAPAARAAVPPPRGRKRRPADPAAASACCRLCT